MTSSNGHGEHVLLPRSPDEKAAKHSRIRQAASAPHWRRRWRRIVILTIFVGGAIAVYLRTDAGGHNARPPTAPPVMISTATATTGDKGVYVKALGTVTPLNTVSVTARVAGQIAKVEYQEGQLVHVGDSLVDIDPAPFQAAVTQAEGQLARDQAQLDLARINLTRDTDLLNKGVISKQEFDTQTATTGQSEGAVQLDQGNLEQAKVNLAYCHITSPIDGRAGLRMIDTGNIVQANGTTPLVVLTQLQPISVEFNVAEDSVPQIVQAMRNGKHLTADAYDRADEKQIATGTLEALNSQIDNTTGTLRLRAIFKNDDDSLFPNQFVNVHLLVDTHKGVTLLPNNAIQRNDNGAFVYLLGPNQTVALKTITVGTGDGNISEVQGLRPGTVVAADSFNRLTNGTKVVVRAAVQPANSPPPSK